MKNRALNTANAITLFRILLVPVFVGVMLMHRQLSLTGTSATSLQYWRWFAITVFAVAAISDGIDGFVARHFNQKTELGTIMDPLADKLLLNAAILVLSFKMGLVRQFPFWFPLIVFTRDLIISLGAVIIRFLNIKMKIVPLVTSKITTFLQMLAVIVLLLDFSTKTFYFVVYSAALLTIISCVQYVFVGLKLVHEAEHNR
ncbi:MAG: hypothetical protein DRI44_06515 [Chlamydiae bacterium]|nr:MAG: hypothetical protein DRI44_06515 [Chlamydiota bacterium]